MTGVQTCALPIYYLCEMGFIDRSITREKELFEYYMYRMKIDMTLLRNYDYEGCFFL